MSRMRAGWMGVLVGVAAGWLVGVTPVAQAQGRDTVRCGSQDGRFVRCQVPWRDAEMIRQEVENLAFTFEGRVIRLTVSIGLASVVPSNELASQTLLNAADQLLYQAKQAGRNRCALMPEALSLHPVLKPASPPAQPAPASSA